MEIHNLLDCTIEMVPQSLFDYIHGAELILVYENDTVISCINDFGDLSIYEYLNLEDFCNSGGITTEEFEEEFVEDSYLLHKLQKIDLTITNVYLVYF